MMGIIAQATGRVICEVLQGVPCVQAHKLTHIRQREALAVIITEWHAQVVPL